MIDLKKLLVYIPEDGTQEWGKVLEKAVFVEKNEYGLMYEFNENEFVNLLNSIDSIVRSNDYSEDGLYGITNHILDSNERVIGQMWNSREEYDNYQELNKHYY